MGPCAHLHSRAPDAKSADRNRGALYYAAGPLLCPECGAKNLPTAAECVVCAVALETHDGDDPLIGRTIASKYLIDGIIGEGSMGCVYAAGQVGLDKEVALKILHAHVAADPKVTRRFHREARTTSRLTHPNTVQILDFGADEDGTLYLAMELLDGPNLLELMNEESPLSPRRIGHLLGGVLLALEEAHDHGIVHRDLKPENVMVVADHQGREHVKVCDFGIAKLVEHEGSAITVTGFVCGTPEYMAPEQARGESLDGRADLYALGCVLYRMLTGSPPFRAGSALGTITKHLTDDPEPPRRRAPDQRIPYALESVCLTALAKDRNARFPDAASMRLALASAVDELGELADDPLGTLTEDPTAALPPRGRRSRALIWAAPLLAVAGVLAIGALLFGPSAGEEREVVVRDDASADAGDRVASASDASSDAGSSDGGTDSGSTDAAADAGRLRRDARTRTPSVEMDPGAPEVSPYERGRQRFLNNDLRGAIAAFESAARQEPRNPQIQKELGRAYMRAGDSDRGRAAYRRYLQLAPSAPDRALIERMLQ